MLKQGFILIKFLIESTSDVLKQQLLNYKNLRLPLEKQLEAIMAALELSQKGVEQRKEIISKLESWLSISFPGCRLLPFGSSVSGLSYLNSDLDMYLELPSLIAGSKTLLFLIS
jgi:DNA polymerase sigma